MKNPKPKSVDGYITAAPKEAQLKLGEIRRAIREIAPDAFESISYGMPFYSYQGKQGIKGRLLLRSPEREHWVLSTPPSHRGTHGRAGRVCEYKVVLPVSAGQSDTNPADQEAGQGPDEDGWGRRIAPLTCGRRYHPL
jgi:hypothetical protein